MLCTTSLSRYCELLTASQAVVVDDTQQATSDGKGPVQMAIHSELSRQLDYAMNRLPYKQKEAIVLYLHGRLKFRAIGRLQNVSTKTAHKRYRAGYTEAGR